MLGSQDQIKSLPTESYGLAATNLRSLAEHTGSLASEIAACPLQPQSTAAKERSFLKDHRNAEIGLQQAALLDEVRQRIALLYQDSADLTSGVADLLEAANRRAVPVNAEAARVIHRSAAERTATATWLLCDARTLALADLVPIDDGFWDRAGLLTPEEKCRRLVVWELEQLRQSRAWVESAKAPEDERSALHAQVELSEAEAVRKARSAGWKVRERSVVDGSWSPACLLREGTLKPERMPTISELVGEFKYALLSRSAHASHGLGWAPYNHLDSLYLLSVAIFALWSGFDGEDGRGATALNGINDAGAQLSAL